MPKKSFPITPESKPYSDPYENYSRSFRERAMDFLDEAMDPVSIGACIGFIAGAGAAYGLSPDVRDVVNHIPEYMIEVVTSDIDNGNIPGIGFGDSPLQQSDAFEGAMFGSYSPAEANTFPIEVTPGTTYTIPGSALATAVQTQGK